MENNLRRTPTVEICPTRKPQSNVRAASKKSCRWGVRKITKRGALVGDEISATFYRRYMLNISTGLLDAFSHSQRRKQCYEYADPITPPAVSASRGCHLQRTRTKRAEEASQSAKTNYCSSSSSSISSS